MKIYKFILVLAVTVFLSGCAVLDALIPKSESPKTPKIFKKIAKTNDRFVKENYIINKPFAYVKSRIKKRYKACLKRTHKSTSSDTTRFAGGGMNTSIHHIYTKYTPTLKTYKKWLELSIQSKRRGEGISIGSNSIDPPKGPYFMVIDAYRLKGNKKTKISVYRWDFLKFGIVSKAVVNWASGKSTACPDFNEVNKPNIF